MGEVFVDTSAIYATLVSEDRVHPMCRKILAQLEQDGARLVSSSFVVHEVVALLQSRIGIKAVRLFHQSVSPMLTVIWITTPIYEKAMAALLGARSQKVSLTDWTSFEIMRERNIQSAFAFDKHFIAQGFKLLNAPK